MTRGGYRPGSGQPPIAGVRQRERINIRLTEAERAEIEAAVPENRPVGRWIVEAAAFRARIPPDLIEDIALAIEEQATWFRKDTGHSPEGVKALRRDADRLDAVAEAIRGLAPAVMRARSGR